MSQQRSPYQNTSPYLANMGTVYAYERVISVFVLMRTLSDMNGFYKTKFMCHAKVVQQKLTADARWIDVCWA